MRTRMNIREGLEKHYSHVTFIRTELETPTHTVYKWTVTENEIPLYVKVDNSNGVCLEVTNDFGSRFTNVEYAIEMQRIRSTPIEDAYLESWDMYLE